MKGFEPMNWTKRQTQYYGLFMCVLGIILGILCTNLVIGFIRCCGQYGWFSANLIKMENKVKVLITELKD